jgi:hypothetical protein
MSRRPRKPGLFQPRCLEDGKYRKLRREEIAECYRLMSKHADIRLGKVKA